MSTLRFEIGEVPSTIPGWAGPGRRGDESVKPRVDLGLAVVLLVLAAPILIVGMILVTAGAMSMSFPS